MKHIFISYSHADTAIMKRVRAELIQADLVVWTDEGIEPGTASWKDSIEKAIKEASCVIALMSPHAKVSEWVNREIDYAQVHKIRVFPVLVAGDESEAVPFALISSQRTDLRSNKQYVMEADKLIKSVCQHLEVQQKPETHVVKRARRKKRSWIAAVFAILSILAAVAAYAINYYLNKEEPPETPLEHLIADADEDLCPGSSAEEYVAALEDADLATTTSCVQNLLEWEDEADDDQVRRLEDGSCDIRPSRADLEDHIRFYWELDYLAIGYFTLANRLRDADRNEAAYEAYRIIVNDYSCAWSYDTERQEFEHLAPLAQVEIDKLRGD